MASERWLLGAPVEIPRRDPQLAAELVRSLAAAGLAPRTLRSEREGRDAADPALRGALALFDAMHPVDSAHELGAPEPFDPDRLRPAIDDPTVGAIQLSDGVRFGLRMPLGSGFLAGFFAADAFDPGAAPLANALMVLFDSHLCEWGLVGQQGRTEREFAGVRLAGVTAPLPLPDVAAATYLGPDLAYGVDAAAIDELSGVRPTRTRGGGVLFACVDRSEETVAALRRVLSPLLEPAPRAPVSEIEGLTPAPILLRDASPSLAAYQLDIAGAAVAAAEERGVRGPELTLEWLAQLDRCLSRVAAMLPPRVLKGWSAFAGEVLVTRGGRWRRILDPYTPYPENLLVAMPHGGMVQPHAQLMLQIRSGRVTGLAELISQLG